MVDWLNQLLPPSARLRVRPQRRPAVPSLVTVLEVDGDVLRVAQARNPTTLKLVATAPLKFAPQADRTDAAVVGAATRQALAGLKLHPSSVVMGVARHRVVLRTLRLPVIEDLAELASLVHLQTAKDLPFPALDAVIDFKVGRLLQSPTERAAAPKPDAAGNEPEPVVPRMEVLVAALKRDEVEFHQQLATAAGLKLAALGLLPDAKTRCMEACQVTSPGEVLALVTLRPDEVSVEVMAGASLLFSRGSTVRAVGETPDIDGAVEVTADAFVQAAGIEAVRSLHGYGGTEPNWPVSKVIVAGATGCEAALVETIRTRVAVPCSQLDPAQPLGLPPEQREAAAASVGAIGLALGLGDETGLPFDFLNPKRPLVQRNVRRLRILAGATCAVVLLIALLGVRKLLIDRRTNVLNVAAAELAAAEKNRPLYRAMISQANLVSDWVKGGRNWLEHYAYLTSILPPSDEVYLTSLAVDSQGVLRLAVQARSGEILARLNKQLQDGGYQVKPFAINPGANRFGYEFRSNLELKPSSKLKIELAKLKYPARPSDDVSLDPKAWRRGAQ